MKPEDEQRAGSLTRRMRKPPGKWTIRATGEVVTREEAFAVMAHTQDQARKPKRKEHK